jgi:shikimate kinase
VGGVDHIFLVGMMGVGKTTVGRLLAERLGRPYIDSDEQVMANTGKTVPEIFESDGEPAFRAQEKQALEQAVASPVPAVISVAGGAVLDPANRELLKANGKVVWLRARVDTMAQRVGRGEGRPLLGDDPGAVLARLYPQRRPLYEEVADVVVDVDDARPEEIVDKIVAAL